MSTSADNNAMQFYAKGSNGKWYYLQINWDGIALWNSTNNRREWYITKTG